MSHQSNSCASSSRVSGDSAIKTRSRSNLHDDGDHQDAEMMLGFGQRLAQQAANSTPLLAARSTSSYAAAAAMPAGRRSLATSGTSPADRKRARRRPTRPMSLLLIWLCAVLVLGLTLVRFNRVAATGNRKGDGSSKALTLRTLNPSVLKAEYAVRGEIAIRAEQLREVRLENVSRFSPLLLISLW